MLATSAARETGCAWACKRIGRYRASSGTAKRRPGQKVGLLARCAFCWKRARVQWKGFRISGLRQQYGPVDISLTFRSNAVAHLSLVRARGEGENSWAC